LDNKVFIIRYSYSFLWKPPTWWWPL